VRRAARIRRLLLVDHYLKMSAVSGLPGPLDTWTTMAGLARDTTRLRLGSLVTPVTFRNPGRSRSRSRRSTTCRAVAVY
jgi:alkanesulfonate monooxygenase SsuD/methylene tetrahydromethanopterin reductase-like flavin-dependent oxidoreductase (luciferase family)